MAGFTKKIRKIGTAPADGSEPLTVIEFSLTNRVRDSLKRALKPYVMHTITESTPSLEKILAKHFPPEVLADLKRLNDEKNNATVYVVQNLPEVSLKDIPKDLLAHLSDAEIWEHREEACRDWAHLHSYAKPIIEGLGGALGMKPQSVTFALVRDGSDESVRGEAVHSHEEPITALGGIMNLERHKSPTRFIDMQTLADEVAHNPKLAAANMMFSFDGKSSSATLGGFFRDVPGWKRPQEIEVQLDSGDKKVNALVARHTQEIVLEPGSLLLWPNGRIYHAATLHPKQKKVNAVTRIAMGGSYERSL